MRVVPPSRTGSFSAAMSYTCFRLAVPCGAAVPQPSDWRPLWSCDARTPNISLPFVVCVSLLLKLSFRFYFAVFVLKNGACAGHIRLILGGFCT